MAYFRNTLDQLLFLEQMKLTFTSISSKLKV